MVFYLRTGNWYSLHKIVENMKGCKELFDVSINGQGCHWLTAHAGGCTLHHSASVYVIFILRSNLFFKWVKNADYKSQQRLFSREDAGGGDTE